MIVVTKDGLERRNEMPNIDSFYQTYLKILENNLQPATGCTEPIAIAFAAAVARNALESLPETVRIYVSGNIIKNAKSVTIPNTGGKQGIKAACAAGLIAGDTDKGLEVIDAITPAQILEIDAYLARDCITISLLDEGHIFDILIEISGHGHEVRVRIVDQHTKIVLIQRDDDILHSQPFGKKHLEDPLDKSPLSVEKIFDFAMTCRLEDVNEIISRQIAYNKAIAEEGLVGNWGAKIGRTLLDTANEQDVFTKACAYTAAGSDARMGGCQMPVIINSGIGNQGLTVSLPVIFYAEHLGSSVDKLYRALVLSNLVAIHQKSQIGYLSAYCGVISAASASGAGIAFLQDADLDVINHTIVNTLAILSGTICDGAKPSCAAKIASAVNAALLGYNMALHKREFYHGEGIVKKGVENTIRSVGQLARKGMTTTDQEILSIMVNDEIT